MFTQCSTIYIIAPVFNLLGMCGAHPLLHLHFMNRSNLTGTYPGVTQYSYTYGQGYGDYAAYNAYLQQAAYAGYPGQYYQGD